MTQEKSQLVFDADVEAFMNGFSEFEKEALKDMERVKPLYTATVNYFLVEPTDDDPEARIIGVSTHEDTRYIEEYVYDQEKDVIFALAGERFPAYVVEDATDRTIVRMYLDKIKKQNVTRLEDLGYTKQQINETYGEFAKHVNLEYKLSETKEEDK